MLGLGLQNLIIVEDSTLKVVLGLLVRGGEAEHHDRLFPNGSERSVPEHRLSGLFPRLFEAVSREFTLR